MNATILSSGGIPPWTLGLGYDSSRIFRWIMPMKSEPRIRATDGST